MERGNRAKTKELEFGEAGATVEEGFKDMLISCDERSEVELMVDRGSLEREAGGGRVKGLIEV